MDTAPKRLHQALDVEVLGLPKDYHSAYAAKVSEVTVERANAAVKRRVSAADLLDVVDGTAAEIPAPIEKVIAGLAEVSIVPFDSDGGVPPPAESGMIDESQLRGPRGGRVED